MTKTDFENELHTATSNDLNFPTQASLKKISEQTRQKINCDSAIKHLIKKLQTPKQKWRKILKALNLTDELVKSGAKRISVELISKIFLIQNLIKFTHRENSMDIGGES